MPAPADALAEGMRVTLGSRPGWVQIVLGALPGIPIEVALVEQLGGSSLIHVVLPSVGEIVVQEPGHNLLRRGTKVHAVLPLGHCYLYREDGTAIPRKTQPAATRAAMALAGH
jgi:multiple sugar transport system ATP-binding protein